MAFADSSETRVAFTEEASFGVTPAAPLFQQLRVTSESLQLSVQNVISDEIRPDASVAELIRVGTSVSGELEMELSFGATDTERLLEHALRGSFAADLLQAGTQRRSLTLEKRFGPASQGRFFRYRGCRIGRFRLAAESGQMVRVSLGFTGLEESLGEVELAGASHALPNANPVMAAADIAEIAIGGLAGTLACTGLSLEINNNLRAQTAVGSLRAAGIGYGRREVTGTLTAYFEDGGLYSLFAGGEAASLSFATSDGQQRYLWSLPRIKFTSGRVVAQGPNRDVLAELQFQGLADPGSGSDISVSRTVA